MMVGARTGWLRRMCHLDGFCWPLFRSFAANANIIPNCTAPTRLNGAIISSQDSGGLDIHGLNSANSAVTYMNIADVATYFNTNAWDHFDYTIFVGDDFEKHIQHNTLITLINNTIKNKQPMGFAGNICTFLNEYHGDINDLSFQDSESNKLEFASTESVNDTKYVYDPQNLCIKSRNTTTEVVQVMFDRITHNLVDKHYINGFRRCYEEISYADADSSCFVQLNGREYFIAEPMSCHEWWIEDNFEQHIMNTNISDELGPFELEYIKDTLISAYASMFDDVVQSRDRECIWLISEDHIYLMEYSTDGTLKSVLGDHKNYFICSFYQPDILPWYQTKYSQKKTLYLLNFALNNNSEYYNEVIKPTLIAATMPFIRKICNKYKSEIEQIIDQNSDKLYHLTI